MARHVVWAASSLKLGSQAHFNIMGFSLAEQSWKMIAHAWLGPQSARLEQHILNERHLESYDFAVKFQFVFRYETVVFRRHVSALLLVILLQKFEADLVYLSLIWGKIQRRFSCFQKFRHFSYMFPGSPRELVTCAIVLQLYPFAAELSAVRKASRKIIKNNT